MKLSFLTLWLVLAVTLVLAGCAHSDGENTRITGVSLSSTPE